MFRSVCSALALFGHFGDRGARMRWWFTLVIMGGSSVGVGLIPSADAIGVAAPLLLIAMRLLQGFAVGGEWAGAALMSAEQAPQGQARLLLDVRPSSVSAQRWCWLTSSSSGYTAPLVTSDIALPAMGLANPVPLSAVLLAVALYIRLHIEESTVFTEVGQEGP